MRVLLRYYFLPLFYILFIVSNSLVRRISEDSNNQNQKDFNSHLIKLQQFALMIDYMLIEPYILFNKVDEKQLLWKMYLVCVIFFMQKFGQAKQLSLKAQNFNKEGNYEYAIRCYDKIIFLLRELIKEATSQETISQLKGKIQKFVLLKSQAEARNREKQDNKPKVVAGFGFPGSNSLSAIRVPQKKQKKSEEIHIKYIDNEVKKPPIFKNKNIQKIDDPAIQDLIVKNLDVTFKDISGLTEAKAMLEEAVIRPRQRPDLYTGIRAPPRGILLYGPPGNGKTYICKALAKESGCTFFALSASSILNKLVGQSQKTIKKIFLAAQKLAPSIIFIDQIDSMLTSRSQNQNDASRRLKTQFLVLMDGINSPKNGQILVIGATNLPNELDSAAKRRFSKMIYIPNPDSEARMQLLLKNLKEVPYDLSKSEMSKIVDKLDYYSASQIRNIIAQACMIPLRELEKSKFQKIDKKDVRKVGYKDFINVISQRKPIISKQELAKYKDKI